MVKLFSLAGAVVALASIVSAAPAAETVYTVSCSKQYIVKSGDTCSKIGKAFNVYTSSIFKWNPSINPSCTNLYIGQIICLSAPTTKTSKVPLSTTPTPTKTKSTTTTKTKTATILTMTNTAQCKTDDDCPGVYCCNLFNNQCVLDPNGTICDIKPTTAVIKTTVSNSKTITTVVTKTNTTPKPTATAGPVPTGKTVQISSAKDFCLFLPPSPGNKAANGGKVDTDAIANSEKNAVTFCTVPNVNAPGAGIFPSGFITSATYAKNTAAGFVQIRGSLKISAYSLSSKDEGGQYDNHGAGSPPGSVCAGYPYYVSLIEPSTADFCIRCCESYSDCNAGRSAYGCNRVVPAI